MQLHIIAVGKKMPDWVDIAFNDYAKRLKQDHPILLTEIAPEKPGNQSETVRLEREAQKIRDVISRGSHTLLLNVTGKTYSTQTLAQQFAQWQSQTSILNFVIGGADGLAQTLTNEFRDHWSLSPLTFPHPLVRVLLVEQLYRVVSFLGNHPYHRE